MNLPSHDHRCGLVFTLLLAVAASGWNPGRVRADDTAVARWSFDGPDAARLQDATGHGHDLRFAVAPPHVGSIEGVFDSAIELDGPHRLELAGPLDCSNWSGLLITAWVRPARFDRYNEILRKEDGEHRLLFSFQENGTVLSLGLDLGGYVECDAPIEPATLLDGNWHFCAATCDGRHMKVYLDGREIGALERPGPLRAGGPAPVCIGSMNGTECFQGAIDELTLGREALAPDVIAARWDAAHPTLERQARAVDARVASLFVPANTFAQTLARSRSNLAAQAAPPDRTTAAALRRKLQENYPDACREFTRTTGVDPLEYLTATGPEDNARIAGRLVELLVEYRPLTASQWDRTTPEERHRWAGVTELERQFASLEARGTAARFDPAWIELMVNAGRQIQLRPYVQEAVAPYVRPTTPETRNLPPDEARALRERDWLHQADQQPTGDRIRREIAWTRALATRLERRGAPVSRIQALLGPLDELARQARDAKGLDPALYFRVRELKRRIMFANPAVDFDRVLFLDSPLPQGSEWQHETRHRLGSMAVPGGRLLVLEGLAPDGHVRQLLPQAPLHGSFWRPDLDWSGERVVVSFKPHNEKSFHLYEVNLDGSSLRQLTDGPFDDLDPIYLPDERHLVFTTTRGNTYVRCMPPTSAFVLARCERDGSQIYLISANNEPDYLPSVLPDGRLVYTRWEYTDKPLWRAQKLWTAHPDGTQVSTLWGNQSVWPDVLKDARAIPGSHRVMFTGSAHHDWFAGSVGIIDPRAGLNFPAGLTKITADVPWPECGNGPVDSIESPSYHSSGNYPAYYSPYPLSEEDFLVSARRNDRFRLYLMDVEGNRELIYEGAHHVLHALPVRRRTPPPALPDQVNWPLTTAADHPKPGLFFSRNIYEGAPAALHGKARYLRVLSIDHKTYTYWHQRPYISTGPVVSGVQSDGVKRILGTVPIESDGSVAFTAPAGVPLHFQLLDEQQRALQTMRSFANLMPGEQRGCLGCHEQHTRTPSTYANNGTLPPVRPITPPPWPDQTVSFARYVRPVLDQYCARCHTGEGEGRKTVDLTARPGFLGFDETYWLLIGRPSWGQPYQPPQPPPPGWGIADMLMVEAYGTTDPAAYLTPAPETGLSSRSRLIELARSGRHHDVRVDPVSWQRLIAWVDTMCPYRGEEEIREIPDPEFQGIDWLAVRPRIRSAPNVLRPGPVN